MARAEMSVYTMFRKVAAWLTLDVEPTVNKMTFNTETGAHLPRKNRGIVHG